MQSSASLQREFDIEIKLLALHSQTETALSPLPSIIFYIANGVD